MKTGNKHEIITKTKHVDYHKLNQQDQTREIRTNKK